MATIYDKLTAVGDAIRNKTGARELLSLDKMASSLNAIPDNDSSDLLVNKATVTVPAGNYKTQCTKTVAETTQSTPNITVSSNGLITASVDQTAGYVSSGTKTATKQLSTKGAATITPGTQNQTINAGVYLTGAQTVVGDMDLVPGNIRKGANIFGVDGVYTDLKFVVVGGTTQPTNPTENMIWVVTDTPITGYYFSADAPTNLSNGEVWISVGTSSPVSFEAVNDLVVYPLAASQQVYGSLTSKVVKTYRNGSWVQWKTSLYEAGDHCVDLTGGWQISHCYYMRDDYGSYVGGTPYLDENVQNGYIGIVAQRSEQQSGLLHTRKKINLTNYKTLKMTGGMMASTRLNANGILIRSSLNHYYVWDYAAKYEPTALMTELSGTFSVDISNLTGEYYICLACCSYLNDYGDLSHIHMTSMWLEG